MNEGPLTEHSPAGTYYVITRSRSVYQIILAPDLPPQITRYRAGANVALHDGEPLPGVSGFRFHGLTGEGTIYWWKNDPADRDDPDAPYVGSVRQTSPVHLILRDDTGAEAIAPPTAPAAWPDEVVRSIVEDSGGSLLDKLRLGLAGADDALFQDFIATVVAEHGREG